jgi:hypothetical protein
VRRNWPKPFPTATPSTASTTFPSKLDGQLHVIEATSRFTSREQFVRSLEALGFAVVTVEDKWKFTHVRALKTERRSRADVEVQF